MAFKVIINGVEFDAVRAHAVERTENGTDGNPFTSVPAWLVELTDKGLLDYHVVAESDWAHFRLKDTNGHDQIVHPGDLIIHHSEVGTFVILEHLAAAIFPETAGT